MFEEKKRYINSRCEIAYILSKPASGVGTQRPFLRRCADPSFLGESSHVPRTTPTNVPPSAVYVEEERRKKNNCRAAEGGTYLVLRARRVCNHRGTAKRPSTPSHSASRHSIFFSPRPGSVPAARALSLRGPASVLSRSPSPFAEASCLCFSSSVSARHDERAHSVIIIGSRQPDPACAAHLFSAFLPADVS